MADTIQVLRDPESQFGHYTNNCMNIYRYYSRVDEPLSLFGMHDQLPEMIVLSQFFNLYDQNWQGRENLHYGTEVDGIRRIERKDNTLKISENEDEIDQPSFLTLGYFMKLLQAPLRNATTGDMRIIMKQQIANGLEKYFGSQLIYCFLLGTGLFGNKGVRIYFDQLSLELLKHIHVPVGDELSFTLMYRHVLSHLINKENRKIYEIWNALCAVLQVAFNNTPGIRIEIIEDINASPEVDSFGDPINPNIKNIKFILNGDNPDHILECFVKMYQYFMCFNKLDHRNKYVEFYGYEFTHPAYIDTYKVLLKSIVEDEDPIECVFQYHIGQGFIGQAIRYIALSQTSYILKIPGVPDTRVDSPTIIHIRDAHHACPTVFETALMSVFAESDKRCFFTTGLSYQTPWHNLYKYNGERIIPGDRTDDLDARGIPRGDRTRSIWAGLQSFKKLPGDECVFGSISAFRQTIGIMFHHHQLPKEYRCELYGIKFYDIYKEEDQDDVPGEFYLFSYGIDERLFVNCFYPQLWVQFRDDGSIENIRSLTAEEHEFAAFGRLKTTVDPFPDKPETMPNAMYEVFDTVFNKKFVYIIDLDRRAIAMNLLSNRKFDLFTIDSKALPRALGIDLLIELKSYIEYNKSCPKSHYDLIKHIEGLRQFEYPLIEHTFASVYHNGSTLFRSYNQQLLSKDTEVYYNQILSQINIKYMKDIFDFLLKKISPELKKLIRLKDKKIYVNDVYSFVKNSLVGVNPCVGSVLDGRHGRTIGNPKFGKCMTQPYDYPGVRVDGPGYMFRALQDNPIVDDVLGPFPEGKMKGGSRRDGNRTRRRKQRGGSIQNMDSIKQFLSVIAFKDSISKDTVQKVKPIAYEILLKCINEESMFEILNAVTLDVYPYEYPKTDTFYDDIDPYYEQPMNCYCQMHIFKFISNFKEYMKHYDNSYSAVEYYDVYFNLETKPNIVHHSSTISVLPFIKPQVAIVQKQSSTIFKNVTRKKVRNTGLKTVKMNMRKRNLRVDQHPNFSSQQLIEV